jgi:hypothetical protein
MPGTYRPHPRVPAPLAACLAQADDLARTLQRMTAKATPSDAASLWLIGRADEVRTLVDEVAREWAQGSIGVDRACEAIQSYVGAIHLALHRRYGGYGASCCGPHLEPFSRKKAAQAPARGIRPRLESSVQSLTMEGAPASRVRLKYTHASHGMADHVASIPALRRSVG